MKRSTARLALVVAALMVTGLLAGCTHPAPVNTDAATRTPTSSANPTPKTPVAPTVRFETSCDDLLDVASLASALAPSETDDTVRSDPEYAAARQSGYLYCNWGDGSSGSAASVTVSLAVSPDVDAGRADIDAAGQVGGSAGSLGVGLASMGDCYPRDGAAVGQCQGQAVSDTAWVSLQMNGVGPANAARPSSVSSFTKILGGVLDKLGSVEIEPAWSNPGTAWLPLTDCATLGSRIDLSAATGSAGTWAEWNKSGIEDAVALEANYRDLYNCAWASANPRADGTKTTITLNVLPGADWVWPQLSSVPGVVSTSLTVPGADQAFLRCTSSGSNTYCWGDALYDHAWAQVMDTQQPAPMDATYTTALLTAVVAASPVA